jgi:hypothetical protein
MANGNEKVLETKVKHLEMIQAVISRMAGNQVQLRTWSVALGTAVIGYVAAKDGNPHAALLAALPAITFWIQDGYYLALEMKFRGLFNSTRTSVDSSTFSMDLGELSASDWLRGCARPGVWLVHLPVLILAIGIGACRWLQH